MKPFRQSWPKKRSSDKLEFALEGAGLDQGKKVEAYLVVSKRFVKKQQQRWTKQGVHLLLQVRTQVLNEKLAQTFQRWYPGFKALPITTSATEQLAT